MFTKTSVPEITVKELYQRQQQGESLVIIDVREPVEYREGHIAQSQLIPLGQLAQRHTELPKDQTIYVSCRSGNRSGMAAEMLNKAGYKAVNMQGGLIEWKRLELPVERS
jgi:rhodanese-related sulfurtransferase